MSDSKHIEYVEEIVRQAHWSLYYHEERLKAANSEVRCAREMIDKLGFKVPVVDPDDEGDDDMIECADLEEFTRRIYVGRVNSLAHHEDGVREAHSKIALVTILLERGNYTDIDVEKIAASQKKRLEEER